MEEVLRRYLGDELAERKKIHEEEMKELSKSVLHTCKHTDTLNSLESIFKFSNFFTFLLCLL